MATENAIAGEIVAIVMRRDGQGWKVLSFPDRLEAIAMSRSETRSLVNETDLPLIVENHAQTGLEFFSRGLRDG